MPGQLNRKTGSEAAATAGTELLFELASGLSGVALALFMWGHMVLVGSILTGARGFDWLAGMLEKYYIAQPTVIGVTALFLVHAVFASRKIPAQLRERKKLMTLAAGLRESGKGWPRLPGAPTWRGLLRVRGNGRRVHQRTDRSEHDAWTHPVIANGKLYIRDQDVLLCYDVKKSKN
jgi:hypothetical protein